ncbi:MAG: VWA domain-containing protein [Planctomycetes bacterium]|nr:VWA domain-containing protein [Planctomycetota bacterium]
MRALRVVPLLAALALSLVSTQACAEERRVAIVVDRSASLHHSDPKGSGLIALVEALALALRSGDRVALALSDAPELAETSVQDLKSAVSILRGLLAAGPRPGGADLQRALVMASKWAGAKGTVVVYSDDDLDVISSEGRAPAAALALARKDEAQPARDAVNRAALRLLRQAFLRQKSKPRLIGLKAALPAGGASTPFLEALGAEVFALNEDAVALVAARIRGVGIVGKQLRVPASQRDLKLPYPARIVIRSADPIKIPGGQQLDRAGRLWSLEVSEALGLPAHGGSIVSVAPTLTAPEGVLAYRLRAGGIRVVAPSASPGTIVVRAGGRELVLNGEPPQADLGRGREKLYASRVIGTGRAKVLGPAIKLSPVDAEVQLQLGGRPEVGQPLRIMAVLPPGFMAADLVLEASEGGGRREGVTLTAGEGLSVSGSFVPRGSGPLELRAKGPLAIRLDAPLEVAPAPSYALEVVSVQFEGQEVDLDHPLPRGGTLGLKVRVAVRPAPPSPIRAAISLGGVEGARLTSSNAEISLKGGEQELSLTIELPAEMPDDARSLGLLFEPVGGAVVPGRRGLPIEAPRNWKQSAIALGLMAVAVIWFLIVVVSRRRDKTYLGLAVGRKQVRTVGTNGRISPECYLFSHHFLSRDEGVVIEPDDSPGGALHFRVRDDGAVECSAREGARLIHQDRPTILATSLKVEHGTAFAMVFEQRALRYVYLEADPTGDELTEKIFSDQASYEAEIRDSGVFVILDDDENMPKASARMEASAEMLFPSSEEFESSEDLRVVPSDSARQYQVSDEGIVVMNSDEGKILDSNDDLEMLTSGEMRAAEADFDALGMDISLGEIMPGDDSADPDASGEDDPESREA